MVNLDDIKIHIPEDYSNKIMVTKDVGVVMGYPKFKDVDKWEGVEGKPTELFKMIVDNIDMVFDQTEVYDNFSEEEMDTFIDSLPTDALSKMMNFYRDMPKLSHTITFTCPECGETEEVVVEGLQSFFT